MLILRRKVGETLVIDGKIKIMICAIEGNRIKISIDAPPEVNVVREELLKRGEKEALQ